MDTMNEDSDVPIGIFNDWEAAVDHLNGITAVTHANLIATLVRILWDHCRDCRPDSWQAPPSMEYPTDTWGAVAMRPQGPQGRVE